MFSRMRSSRRKQSGRDQEELPAGHIATSGREPQFPPAETTPMAFRRPRLSAGEVAYAAKDRLHGAALKVMFDAILERATVDVQGLADRLDRVRDVGLAVRVAHDERGHEQAALDGLLQEERAKGL